MLHYQSFCPFDRPQTWRLTPAPCPPRLWPRVQSLTPSCPAPDRAILLGFVGGLRRCEIVRLDRRHRRRPRLGRILEKGMLVTLRGKTGCRKIESRSLRESYEGVAGARTATMLSICVSIIVKT